MNDDHTYTVPRRVKEYKFKCLELIRFLITWNSKADNGGTDFRASCGKFLQYSDQRNFHRSVGSPHELENNDNDTALKIYSCGICGCMYNTEHGLNKHLKEETNGYEMVNKTARSSPKDFVTKLIPVFFVVKQLSDSTYNEPVNQGMEMEGNEVIPIEMEQMVKQKENKYQSNPKNDEDVSSYNPQIFHPGLIKGLITKCQQSGKISGSRNTEGEQQNTSNQPKCETRPTIISLEACDSRKKALKLGFAKEPDFKCYSCLRCGKVFTRKKLLQSHNKMHTRENVYVCTKCEERPKFSTVKEREKHYRTLHRIQKYRSKGHLNQKALCEICGKQLATSGVLRDHLERMHAPAKKYPCSVCGKAYHRKQLLDAHQVTHTMDNPFMCDVCGKGFKTRNGLTSHSKLHDESKWFTCSNCGRGFKSRSNLRRHLLSHSGVKQFACNICGKAFTRNLRLKLHMRTAHEGEEVVHKVKPKDPSQRWHCELCGNSFAYPHCLKRHLRVVHTKQEKVFKCDTCEKAFHTKDLLKKHIGSHNVEKKYKCPQCNKSFRTRDYLYLHRYAHEGRRWLCKLCNKMLPPTEVGKHFKLRHKELNNISHWRDLCELYLPESNESVAKDTAPPEENTSQLQDLSEEQCAVESLLIPHLNISGMTMEPVVYVEFCDQ